MLVRILYRYFPHRLHNTVPIYDSFYDDDDEGLMLDCVDFLQSDCLKQVKESYVMECNQPGSFDCLPEGVSSLLDLWISTLNRACYAYSDISLWGPPSHQQDDPLLLQKQQAVWKEVSFLLKGVFYLANNIPLQTIKTQPDEEYILHAAVAALPLCCQLLQPPTIMLTKRKQHLRVFQTVLEGPWAKDQLGQPGPVLGRFPLHIAASNPCSCSYLVGNPKNKSLEVEILERIIKASSSIAASAKDSQGNYPLHLACKNGYSSLHGLDDLFCMAPKVANPSLFVLMAQSVQTKPNDSRVVSSKPNRKRLTKKKTTKKKKSLKQNALNVLRKLISNGQSKFMPNPRGTEDSLKSLDHLNTVYQFLQADPMIFLP